MMLARDGFIDLLTACSAAPSSSHRGAAALLLARELAARLDTTERDYRVGVSPPHFAYAALEGASTAANLNAVLAGNKPRGGPETARRHLHYGRPEGSRAWSSSVGREPSPTSIYAEKLAEVVALAGQLKTLVLASMSSDAWATARQPFLDDYARADFAVRADVARFRVTGNSVAPGNVFQLETVHRPATGYFEFEAADTPEIHVPEAGTYCWHLHGSARSSATTNPLTLSVGLNVGAEQRAVISAVRGSADPTEYVPIGVEQALFLPGEAPAIDVGAVITARNASAAAQSFAGLLTVWSAP
jgi:hypothetical protein